jgi:hypothetical protein
MDQQSNSLESLVYEITNAYWILFVLGGLVPPFWSMGFAVWLWVGAIILIGIRMWLRAKYDHLMPRRQMVDIVSLAIAVIAMGALLVHRFL